MLIGSRPPTNSLWISTRTGQRYTSKNLGTLISKITFRTIGVDVSPHLFRTAAATTAAMYGGDIRLLKSCVLGHSDSRVTYEHYIRATTVNAAKEWGAIVRQYHHEDPAQLQSVTTDKLTSISLLVAQKASQGELLSMDMKGMT